MLAFREKPLSISVGEKRLSERAKGVSTKALKSVSQTEKKKNKTKKEKKVNPRQCIRTVSKAATHSSYLSDVCVGCYTEDRY